MNHMRDTIQCVTLYGLQCIDCNLVAKLFGRQKEANGRSRQESRPDASL